MTLRLLLTVFNQVGKGTYWRTLGFARELAARGHQVTLLASATPEQPRLESRRTDGITLVAVPGRWPATRGSGYDPVDIFSRVRWLRRQRGGFDLVHAFESRPATLVPALMARRRGALYVSDWCDWFGRGGSVEERPSALLRTLLRPVETVLENRSRPMAAGVSAINETLVEKARDLGVAAERLLLLPNGAYTRDFQPRDRAAVRQRLELPLDAPLIAYTGTLFSSDAALMAAAFNQIQEEQPEARLLLIGYTNLDMRPLVRRPEAVLSTGPVSFPELVDYVAASTIGWVPLADNRANAGRFPMKVNDFMAAGRALVVTDVGDLGRVVQSHQIGLVARSNAASVARQTLALLADPDLRKTLERQARHTAESVFAWPIVTDKLEAFYQRLLAGYSKSR